MAKRRKRKRRGPGPAPRQAKPATEPSAVAADDGQRAAARKRANPDGPPPPPWGSFPLSEIAVLVGLVLLVVGFFTPPPRGGVLMGVGLLLGSLAGVELAAREHFSGYRSHTLVLAGAAGVATAAGLLALGGLPPVVSLAVGAAVAAGAAYLLSRAFSRRSGGRLFKVRLWR